MDRRDYVKNVARGGLLGALAMITGILVSRNQVDLSNDCSSGFQCGSCRKSESCELPEAINERLDEKG